MMDVAFLMLAATRPWALGALISILGFGGLAVMFWTRWHESDAIGELTLVFGLMAVGPILYLLPVDFLKAVADSPFDEEIIYGLVLLIIVVLWVGGRFLARYMRSARTPHQRQGRRGNKGRR